MPLRLVASATRSAVERVVDVEQWAELRREYFVAGKSIKRLVRETGLSKNTIRRALRSGAPPRYRRASRPGVLEPFKAEIHRLLGDDPKLPGVRVRELLEPLGCTAGKTVVDDYLREVRPLFAPPPRAFQRTVYRPGGVCQFDVWQPRGEIPVGHGQTRSGWVVVACLGYSRAGAGVLAFSKETGRLRIGRRHAGGYGRCRRSGCSRARGPPAAPRGPPRRCRRWRCWTRQEGPGR